MGPFNKSKVVILTVLIMTLIISTINASAQSTDAPRIFSGRVYTSRGQTPPNGSEGTYAAVILEHNGVKKTYPDPDGLQRDSMDGFSYWVEVPAGEWAINDTYWIQVDGTSWGNMNNTCRYLLDPRIRRWKVRGYADGKDVYTVADDSIPSWFILLIIVLICIPFVIFIIQHMFPARRKKAPP
jgi:hypothetical protein